MLRRVRALACAVALGAAATSMTAPAADAVQPRTALVLGDSIIFESRFAIADQLALKGGWTLASHSYPSTAPCDWIAWLAQDLERYQPSIVVIETVGNFSRPCMAVNGVAPARGSAELRARIAADLETLVAMATATGAKVLIVRGPPMLDATWNSDVTAIGAISVEIARRYPGVSVTGAPRSAVSASGRYVATKPCLATETPAMGCDPATGRIAVRTVTGPQKGVHLCPIGLADGFPYACTVYSSGEARFGKAVANAIVKPPAPLYTG
jgi:hypothetical protein